MQDYLYYDRTVCTGLGDRIGALMTLLTLSRMHNVHIFFKWCEDPSEIYASQRRYMPYWYGYDYNITEFKSRFWDFQSAESGVILLSGSEVHTAAFLDQVEKIDYEHGEVPASEGLDQVYTTSPRTTRVPTTLRDNESFLLHYRSVARLMLLYTLKQNSNIVMMRRPAQYVVLHMRGFDLNAYTPYESCHENPDLYCTKKVVLRVIKSLPAENLPILVISNNISWTEALISHRHIKIVNGTSEYDDFALLMGASGIIQHANRGWSSYSNNPSMIANIPLITTYRESKPYYRYNTFRHYGEVPSEFHGCREAREFVRRLRVKLGYERA